MISETLCIYCADTFTGLQKSTHIVVHGAREHNLQNICFAIPKGKIVALTGPSGSGKSSIATNVLQKECVRQFLESLGMVTDHIEKAKIDNISGLSPSIGVPQRVSDRNPRSTVGSKTGILTLVRNMFAVIGHQRCPSCSQSIQQSLQHKESNAANAHNPTNETKITSSFTCPHCFKQLQKLTMAHFSNNTTEGACAHCKGKGAILNVNQSLILNEEKTIQSGAILCWNQDLATYYENVILKASKHYNFNYNPTIPLKEYTTEQRNFLLYGVTFPAFVEKYKNKLHPKKVSEGNFEGLIPQLLNSYKKNPSMINTYISEEPCLDCNKTGFTQFARETTIAGKTILQIHTYNLNELLAWLYEVSKTVNNHELQIFNTFKDALIKRITNLHEIGLHHLTLNRALPSLSAGESQRLRLANLLGSGLSGVLYVLDEPSTGLHPRDTQKLIKTMRKMQEDGNTVLLIEHDMDIIKQVDYVLDIGPGGGSNGGSIVATGTPTDIMACTTSLTGTYLAQKRTIEEKALFYTKDALIVRGAREHNLKNITVRIPSKQLTVITGPSGSGKSTFLFGIVDKIARQYFYRAIESPGAFGTFKGMKHFDGVVTINQTTIGNSTSSRSNIATYTKLFDYIRDLFASLPEAKSRGFDARSFSFNTSTEKCELCNGAGTVAIDMTFMPDVETDCPQCNGMRFRQDLLAVRFHEYTISQILAMTVNDALRLFAQENKIAAILALMKQVGLEHLTLGQSTASLSGGEAQRIKLASELAKSKKGNTLYLLDEPTNGLHPHEVVQLYTILRQLVNKGNTVVVIEHNLEIISKADTIIDFGPEGGTEGGFVVATGTPHEIMANNKSVTGPYLKEYLEA